MRPSTKELIGAIAEALDTRVAPTVTDPWAASSLRSIGTLLSHLSVRVERELTILSEGNSDLRALLMDAQGRLAGASTPSRPSALTDLESTLGQVFRGPDELATVALLEDESRALKERLETLVRVLHEDREALGEQLQRALLGEIRGYFAREREREAPLYEALAGPMF